jgi:hypothetical protein
MGAEVYPSPMSLVSTLSPFAALQRFGLLSEGLLPCEQRRRQANSCDGFRMPAPLAKLATRTMAGGPAFESRQGRKPREMGAPIGGRYGDFAGADGAAQILERGVSTNSWGGQTQRGSVEG